MTPYGNYFNCSIAIGKGSTCYLHRYDKLINSEHDSNIQLYNLQGQGLNLNKQQYRSYARVTGATVLVTPVCHVRGRAETESAG